jgi:hypothetical protein
MTIRYGALLKFADGVSRSEAIAALKSIKHLLDLPEGGDYEPTGDGRVKWVAAPLKGTDIVKEYNDEHGSPVWYIP